MGILQRMNFAVIHSFMEGVIVEKFNPPVEEFTTPNPHTAGEDTSVEELRRIMNEYGVRHIPITRGEEITGIVSDRDLRLIAGLDVGVASRMLAKDIMARDPVSVSSEARLDEVALEMSERKIGSVLVNEGNKLVGIFTNTDALNALVELTRALRGRDGR